MVGINVPIPVPVGYHSFGGWNDSLFGDTSMYGPEGVRFFNRPKVVTSRWPAPGRQFGRPSLSARRLAVSGSRDRRWSGVRDGRSRPPLPSTRSGVESPVAGGPLRWEVRACLPSPPPAATRHAVRNGIPARSPVGPGCRVPCTVSTLPSARSGRCRGLRDCA